MGFTAHRSVWIGGLFAGVCITTPLAANDFTNNNSTGYGNTAMGMQQQQIRSVQGQGHGFGRGDTAAHGFARQKGYGDGEVNFTMRFKGKGRAEGQNEQKQSRNFMGQMFQSRALQQQMRGNGQSGAYGTTRATQMMPMTYAPYGAYNPYFGNPFYGNPYYFTPYYAPPMRAVPMAVPMNAVNPYGAVQR